MSRKFFFGLLIVAICGSLLYFFFDPVATNLFPKCPFHVVTHLDCPGCGSQRAIHALLHGDIIQAANFNLLLIIFLPLIVYSAVVTIGNEFFNRSWKQRIFYSAPFVRIILVVVLLFWLLRNVPVSPFNWLSADA